MSPKHRLSALIAFALSMLAPLPATAQTASNASAGQEAYNKGDFVAARAKYQIGCMTDGHAEACNNLGAMARKGQGGAKDETLAHQAYKRGCERNQLTACNVYGAMVKDGIGGTASPTLAVQPLTRACAGGFPAACYNMATLYYFGRLAAVNHSKAREFFGKSCPGYAADGCYALGLMLRDGQGGPADPAGAAKAFREACNKGRADGCVEAAVALYSGKGVAKDMAAARDLFGKSCSCEAAALALRGRGGGAPLFRQWLQTRHCRRLHLCEGAAELTDRETTMGRERGGGIAALPSVQNCCLMLMSTP